MITIGIPTTAADARFYTDTAASNDNTVSLSNYQSGYVVGGEAELNLSAIGVTDEEAAVSTASTAETVSAPTVTLAAVGTANNNKVSLTGSTITSSVLGGAAVVNTTLMMLSRAPTSPLTGPILTQPKEIRSLWRKPR